MIFLDKPFVSTFLKSTIKENNFPVVCTEAAKSFELDETSNFLTEEQAIEKIKQSPDTPIYTTSENAIGWLSHNLSFTELPGQIDLFKNKVKFRELIKPLYSEFYFKEVAFNDLDTLSLEGIPMPFIIKPAVGFFSMGVYKVTDIYNWQQVKDLIKEEVDNAKGIYPQEVIDTTSFIIEQCINGEEFAVDAYFNAQGEPVILNIYKHFFSSDEDVSDRVYITSKEIIESNLDEFTRFLEEIGKLTKLKNFPVHVELRRDHSGLVMPIEINPMRFGGWCTTADMTNFAYNFNQYKAYFEQERPDWKQILKNKEKKLYSIIVLDNSTGFSGNEIMSFNYEKLISKFANPLELRKVDYKEYPVFGFLFAETKEDNFSELESILKSDLKEFVNVSNC